MKSLSANLSTGVKRVLGVVLYEIELQNLQSKQSEFKLKILRKKFEHPEDLGRIMNLINEGEHKELIAYDFDYIEFQKKLQFIDNFDLLFPKGTAIDDGYIYLLIKNIERLKSISTNLHTKEVSKENKVPNSDVIKIKTRTGLLVVNQKTGSAKFNNLDMDLNPQSQEFRVLIKLVRNDNYQATYSELLNDNVSTTSKRSLSFVIRNIKELMGILPAKDSKNKDCIKNMKNYGYRLIT